MGTKHQFGRSFAAFALVLGLSVGSIAPVEAATATGITKVTIRQPVTITNLRELDFGRLVATPSAGTVEINPDTGARAVTGGPVAAGGTPQTARFRIVASPATLVLITRNALPVLARTTGGATMPVTLLTMNGTSNPVTTPAPGSFIIDVGGILAVAANQPDGTYEATFEINADYQ